jgi:hypothetical protein
MNIPKSGSQTYVYSKNSTNLSLVVNFLPDAIKLDLRLDGPPLAPGDVPKFAKWMRSIVSKFDRDSRPVKMLNVNSGEQATVLDCGGVPVAFITKS